MIVTDLFESAPDVAEALGDNRPKLGSKRDQGKSVRKWRRRRDRGLGEQGVVEGPTDDPRFQKMMGNIQKSTPAPVSGYVALNFASEQRSKKIKGVSQNGKPMPDVIDNPEEFLSGKIEFTPDQVEKQLTAIGKKYGWDSIDSGQGQGYTEMFFDTSKEYTSNNQNLLAANIANTVSAINKFFNGMNSSLQATGLPGYKTDVWQGMGPPNDTNQIGDLSQIANIAKGKSAKSDPGAAIGKMILKYIPSYEAENDELGYDLEDFASAMAIAKVYIAQGEEAGLRAQLRAEGQVSDMIDELISDAGGNGLRTMSGDDLAEGHGNYAGDRPVNLGGVSMKMIQAGDTVRYIDQKAQVVDMSPDRKYSRITIPSSSTTKTVLTSDLRQLGQGMAEADDEHLDEFNLKDLGSKIFGSSPNANATAAPGSLSTIDSAYMPNPVTGKPYTGAELRAASAQRAKSAAAAAAPTAPATTTVAAPTTSVPSVANVPAGYSKVTQSFKKPSTTPATPNAAGTIGTYNKKTGAATLGDKSMLAFKDLPPNIQKQLAGITEALAQPVAELLQMVETKEDVQRIKKFIDDTFVKHGAVNESAFTVRNQILEHVTQVGAQRRRDFAAQQTH
jgi:hypothetical protein